MAENCGLLQLRTLRSRALVLDNGSRERYALAAFRLASQLPICLTGSVRPAPRGLSYVPFPYGIANTNDHVRPFVATGTV